MSFPFKSILVVTDFSDLGNSAVPVAFRLAKDQGARVILAHVLEGSNVPSPLYASYTFVPTPEQMREAEARARTDLGALVPKELRAVPHEIQVAPGTAATEVCRLAKDNGASLIVISSHGRSGVKHFLLGSVAERVVRHAPCPVLVMR